jgi:hypothetical protein
MREEFLQIQYPHDDEAQFQEYEIKEMPNHSFMHPLIQNLFAEEFSLSTQPNTMPGSC